MTIQQATNSIAKQIAKPDHPFWRKVGNWAVIVAAPVGTVAIEVFIPDPWKRVIQVAWNSIMSLIKFGSKLTSK